jgi:hypothetical protein
MLTNEMPFREGYKNAMPFEFICVSISSLCLDAGRKMIFLVLFVTNCEKFAFHMKISSNSENFTLQELDNGGDEAFIELSSAFSQNFHMALSILWQKKPYGRLM